MNHSTFHRSFVANRDHKKHTSTEKASPKAVGLPKSLKIAAKSPQTRNAVVMKDFRTTDSLIDYIQNYDSMRIQQSPNSTKVIVPQGSGSIIRNICIQNQKEQLKLTNIEKPLDYQAELELQEIIHGGSSRCSQKSIEEPKSLPYFKPVQIKLLNPRIKSS